MVYLLFPVFSRMFGKNDVGVIGVGGKGRCYYAASLTRRFARDDNQPTIERATTNIISGVCGRSCLLESCNTQSISRYFDYAFSWQEIVVPRSRIP